MLLPNICLTQKNRIHNSMDDIEFVHDKQHFLNYKHTVTYEFNSRGFRDSEWPLDVTQLANSIWCIGDSFTVGIGSSYQHIWPQVLETNIDTRTINVSMDGASNDWIARQACQILQEINPTNLIILWSYFQRREHPDSTLKDEDRKIWYNGSTDQEDLDNFRNCIQKVNSLKKKTTVQHYTVPDAQSCNDINITWTNIRDSQWPKTCCRTIAEFQRLPTFIQTEILNCNPSFLILLKRNDLFEQYKIINQIQEVTKLDLARDGYHFDINTSLWLNNQIVKKLS